MRICMRLHTHERDSNWGGQSLLVIDAHMMSLPSKTEMLEVSNFAGTETAMYIARWAA